MTSVSAGHILEEEEEKKRGRGKGGGEGGEGGEENEVLLSYYSSHLLNVSQFYQLTLVGPRRKCWRSSSKDNYSIGCGWDQVRQITVPTRCPTGEGRWREREKKERRGWRKGGGEEKERRRRAN